MIKELIKKHHLFLFKNKSILITIILIFSIFLVVQIPFIFSNYLFWNFNWLIFFAEAIGILLIINCEFDFYYCKSKKNLYDVFLNSNIKSKQKIYLSKSLYIGFATSLITIFKSFLISLMLFYQFQNVKFLFLFFIAFTVSQLFFILFFVLINSFIYIKFNKKNIFTKIIYSIFSVLVILSLTIKILFSFYFSKSNLNFSENHYKVTINEKNYIYKKNNTKNNLIKYEADIIGSFFSLPIYVFNNHLKNLYWENNYIDRKNRINLKSFEEDTKKVYIDDLYNKKIFTYHLNSPSFVQKDTDYIINFVKNNIVKKIYIDNYESFRNKLENSLWSKNDFNNEEIDSLKIFLGINNSKILDFKRDWDIYLKLNSNLRKQLNSLFKFDISNLFDLIYSSEIGKINTSFELLDFYVPNNLNNLHYDETLPILKDDWIFIRDHMLKFDNDVVNINLTYKKYKNLETNMTITKDNFLKIFPKIGNLNDWKQFIDNNLIFSDANQIIKKINEMFHEKGLNYSFNLKSNILPYYNYYDVCDIELNNRKNMDISLIVSFWFLINIFIFASLKQGRKK